MPMVDCIYEFNCLSYAQEGFKRVLNRLGSPAEGPPLLRCPCFVVLDRSPAHTHILIAAQVDDMLLLSIYNMLFDYYGKPSELTREHVLNAPAAIRLINATLEEVEAIRLLGT